MSERRFIVATHDGRALMRCNNAVGGGIRDGLLTDHCHLRTSDQVKPALLVADYYLWNVQVYELVPVDRDQFERGDHEQETPTGEGGPADSSEDLGQGGGCEAGPGENPTDADPGAKGTRLPSTASCCLETELTREELDFLSPSAEDSQHLR